MEKNRYQIILQCNSNNVFKCPFTSVTTTTPSASLTLCTALTWSWHFFLLKRKVLPAITLWLHRVAPPTDVDSLKIPGITLKIHGVTLNNPQLGLPGLPDDVLLNTQSSSPTLGIVISSALWSFPLKSPSSPSCESLASLRTEKLLSLPGLGSKNTCIGQSTTMIISKQTVYLGLQIQVEAHL